MKLCIIEMKKEEQQREAAANTDADDLFGEEIKEQEDAA